MSSGVVSFTNFGLNKNILRAISEIGYTRPFLIQEKCIPYLLDGHDLLGLAQTGSGKTAAFILPLLHNINPILLFPQVLILAPTRELVIQTKDVCIRFSKYIKGINIVSLYGGQSYEVQFRSLRKGSQIVIGTPGRLLDHLNRKTLCLSEIHSVVIDEADKMLCMGFIDDVKLILSKISKNRQTVFFSATFPKEIRHIAHRFTNCPKEVYLNQDHTSSIVQNYWIVSGFRKEEALIRFLEIENFDAVIVFVRTKDATLKISSILEKNGYNSAALNGDISQVIRQRTLECFRNGQLDILVATDVASRGLDLDRVTLVINYDAPMDVQSYIHRIGRTGRAGKIGRSLLFIKNSEYRLLRYIKQNQDCKIQKIKIPSIEILVKNRLERFSDQIRKELSCSTDLNQYRFLLSQIQRKENLDIKDLAAVLLKIAQGVKSFVLSSDKKEFKQSFLNCDIGSHSKKQSKLHCIKSKNNCFSIVNNHVIKRETMNLYRIDIGKKDGVSAYHIIKAISNVRDIKSWYIGGIKLFKFYSFIELSQSIPSNIFLNCSNLRILNKDINFKFLGSVSSLKK